MRRIKVPPTPVEIKGEIPRSHQPIQISIQARARNGPPEWLCRKDHPLRDERTELRVSRPPSYKCRMDLTASAETLAAVWAAMNAPPGRSIDPSPLWSRLAEDGWIIEIDLEDAILGADRRLDRHGVKLRALADMLGLSWRYAFARPASRFDQPSGFQSLCATDAAGLLILLERLGFTLDPEALCTLLRPTLAAASHLTGPALNAFFHDKSQHREGPVTLATNTAGFRGTVRTSVRLASGYRAELTTDDDGTPLWLTVHAPKFRRRPEAELTTCKVCGVTFMKGLPADDREHRRTHRRRQAVIEPQPNRKFALARERDPLGAPWVDFLSAQWKHDLMYGRAYAFKREMGYDFTQWASEPARDPAPVGFLFADEDNRIVGACGFRPQPEEVRPWRLDWIWLCPSARRTGVLSRYWPLFRQRFGEFDLTPPVSDAMQAFLSKHGAAQLTPDHPN